MRPLLSLGIGFGGCLMLVGLLSVCTIIGAPVGIHFIWIGFLIAAAFWVVRQMMR
jgi:hypothetical protein